MLQLDQKKIPIFFRPNFLIWFFSCLIRLFSLTQTQMWPILRPKHHDGGHNTDQTKKNVLIDSIFFLNLVILIWFMSQHSFVVCSFLFGSIDGKFNFFFFLMNSMKRKILTKFFGHCVCLCCCFFAVFVLFVNSEKNRKCWTQSSLLLLF